jgi:hypothetical protein
MTSNLNTLRAQIEEHLTSRGLVAFHGFLGSSGHQPSAYWDTARRPDYQEFIATAEAAGARVITMFANEFSADEVDHALAMLEGSELDPEESRSIESRLREMRAYDGFTCSIELSFDHAGRSYLFELSTEWHDEFNDLRERIDDAYSDADDPEEDDDRPSFGSYYSQN